MRNMTLMGIASLAVLSGFLLASSRIDYRVDVGAVVEIYADIVRDVDNVGLTVTRVSDEREMEIGEETARTMPAGRNSMAGERYISRIGEVLAKHVRRKGIRYRFHLVSSPAINAFAIPGGHVYVTTGMTTNTTSSAFSSSQSLRSNGAIANRPQTTRNARARVTRYRRYDSLIITPPALPQNSGTFAGDA